MFKLPFIIGKKNFDRFFAISLDSIIVRVLVFFHDGDQTRITGFGKAPLQPGAMRAGNIIDGGEVIEAIREALDKASRELEYKVNNAIIGLSGDACLELTTTIKLDRGKKNKITEKEVSQIQDNLIEAAFMQAQNEHLRTTGDSSSNLEIVTSSNVYTRVDGKVVNEAAGKKGAIIESAIYNAFSTSNHLNMIKKIANKAGVKLLAVSPYIYSLAQSIKRSTLESSDFVLMDIEGDTTDVGIVFGGGVVASKTLNVGFTQFIDGISENMGLTLIESGRVLETYCAGRLSESEEDIVKKCLEETLRIWMEGIELVFDEFSEVKTFPSKIHVTGKGSTIPDLLNHLKNKPWTKAIPFKDVPDIRKIEIADMQKVQDATGKIASTSWVPTTSLSEIYLEIKDD